MCSLPYLIGWLNEAVVRPVRYGGKQVRCVRKLFDAYVLTACTQDLHSYSLTRALSTTTEHPVLFLNTQRPRPTLTVLVVHTTVGNRTYYAIK